MLALLHLDHVRVRVADVTHKYHKHHYRSTHKVCGVCLWILSVRSPELLAAVCIQRSLPPLKRDLPLCICSLVLHLDFAAFLLQCCGSFWMDYVLWRKQGLKMHFLHLAALRIPGSLLFVVCGHMCFYVYVGCLKGISFADVKGMMEWFLIFFCYTAYQQPWRGLGAKCSNAGCSCKKGTEHHRIMDHPENPVNSFQLRNG